jgi:hypothetical protein
MGGGGGGGGGSYSGPSRSPSESKKIFDSAVDESRKAKVRN